MIVFEEYDEVTVLLEYINNLCCTTCIESITGSKKFPCLNCFWDRGSRIIDFLLHTSQN